MSTPVVVVRGRRDPVAVERILRALPDWFGMEDALLDYVRHSASHPTYLACPLEPTASGAATHPASGDVVGVLVTARHFPPSAEIHLMAVDPAWHGRGVGRSLLAAAEADLRADGVRLLQVKTLGPTDPDPFYARTRTFYAGNGFEPLEENLDLWPGSPCLIMVKSL
ncbi:N-acetyltransferase [Kineosporia sp. A_224]|uniref:GNAT family N-acetyltransferase n=1 Tax=Kineosporia sp. A_224 TaxID=1962180 RepID=UPI000B4B3A79|nr:GNAT family N-acetyltransferase [Kineosporia sp. A_224]